MLLLRAENDAVALDTSYELQSEALQSVPGSVGFMWQVGNYYACSMNQDL
jgi:hypothetical protein